MSNAVAASRLGRWRGICAALVATLAISGCATLPPLGARPVETAVAEGAGSTLDDLIAPAEKKHPGESAFRLMVEGPESFVIRARSAELATRSLDIQTYIWHDDLTGLALMQRVLDAADRGVKVRLLIDDMDGRGQNRRWAALAVHSNIAVRLFNPFVTRRGFLAMLAEGAMNFRRINQRMHNKSWIADNRIAIVGGRNLGDEYFGAGDGFNFVDLDFAMIGPVVRDASASFDDYWNSPDAYPLTVLDPDGVSFRGLEKLRAQLARAVEDPAQKRYADLLQADDAVQRLLGGDWPMHWAARYRFVADDPLKVRMKSSDPDRSKVIAVLQEITSTMAQGFTVISPYFVPGKSGTQGLVAAVASGKQIQVLTNSLVANDVAAVHGGYSRYRKKLLKGGVRIWELKPLSGAQTQSSFFGSSGASLHTKAFAVDRQVLFVGSYNLDPRSTWLNCEQGILVESTALAEQLEALFALQVAPAHAWQVTIEDRGMQWSDGIETFYHDPHATLMLRFQAWFARTLRLDAQL